MPEVTEPIPATLAATNRRAVLEFRANQHRRVFPTTVHVGDPDGHYESYVDSEHIHRTRRTRHGSGLDHPQRSDIVGVLLDRLEPAEANCAMVWITRSGDVGTVHDDDASWLAAALKSFAEAGLPLTLIVITRSGWYDPRSGVLRRWRRLR